MSKRLGVIGVGFVLAMVFARGVLEAQQVSFPTLARGISSWMARAVDECDPTTVTVLDAGLPAGGCLQSNSVTDDEIHMNFVRLRVSQRGSIGLYGRGFTLGDALRVRLTLRVTKPGVNTKQFGANKRVTFIDKTVDCPKSPDAFAVRPNGSVVGRTDLGLCLDPTSGLAAGNIEILGASLVNASTGKTVASTGMLR